MIDHVSVQVGDYARSKDFYVAALEPLGYELLQGLREPGRRLRA